jgi:hypothetical protein
MGFLKHRATDSREKLNMIYQEFKFAKHRFAGTSGLTGKFGLRERDRFSVRIDIVIGRQYPKRSHRYTKSISAE